MWALRTGSLRGAQGAWPFIQSYSRALCSVADRLLGDDCILLKRHTLFNSGHGTAAEPS